MQSWIKKCPQSIYMPDIKLYYRVIVIKQHDIGTNADMLINEIKVKTHT